MANLSHLKRVALVYAFPGMGKTPFAKTSSAPWIDLDFGYFRTALRVAKSEEKVLYKPYVRLLAQYVDEGWKVLSNSPETIPYASSLLPDKKIIMVLPTEPAFSYSAKKLGVDVDTIAEWVRGWSDTAKLYHVPVYYTERGFDSFMRRLVY